MSSDPQEQKYVDVNYRNKLKSILPNGQAISQRVLLYEVNQLSDPDPQRAIEFQTTLQHFLGLSVPLDPMIWFKPGKSHADARTLEKVNSKKIDICDSAHDRLRAVLQQQAVEASRWIRKYFLEAPGVVVASKEYLRDNILSTWERDPCTLRRQQSDM